MDIKIFIQFRQLGLAAMAVLISGWSAEAASSSPKGSSGVVDVRMVTDEADAVLAILDKRRAGEPVTSADWERLFSSEAYRRMKKRAESFGLTLSDDAFKTFVLSDELSAKSSALARTLAERKAARIDVAGALALAYLPEHAQIKAKIYPVIKAAPNSYVFEVDTDPAIFLYVDPEETNAEFENTLAHEFHHIGYGGSCPTELVAAEIASEPQNILHMIEWVGAFGEGFAMLAAAGGPDNHPHAASKPEVRARWDRDIASFGDDLREVEAFFVDILSGQLTDDQRVEAGIAFLGVQGPWYTVGWKMSAVIEKIFDRETLIESFCDPRRLLPTYNLAAEIYNETAEAPLDLWSPVVIEAARARR